MTFPLFIGAKKHHFPNQRHGDRGAGTKTQAGADAVLHAPRKIFYTLNGVFMGHLPGTMTEGDWHMVSKYRYMKVVLKINIYIRVVDWPYI